MVLYSFKIKNSWFVTIKLILIVILVLMRIDADIS